MKAKTELPIGRSGGKECQPSERVIYDFGVSRVIDNGKSPIECTSDIIVQTKVGNDWQYACGFNSLSNDYAYTSAKEEAQRLARLRTEKRK